MSAMWMVQHCQQPGCTVAIRRPVEHQDDALICKWHHAGVAYIADHPWPAGMPNPELPWPWQTDAERERRMRMPFWRDRFVQAAQKYPEYGAWLNPQMPTS